MAKQRSSGFTILEIMIVLTIAGILAAIAMPSFDNQIRLQRLKGASTELYLSLMFARSEAIKRNAKIDVRRNAAGWMEGWYVRIQDTGEDLRVNEKLNNITLKCNINSDPAADTCPLRVTFEGSGRPTSIIEFRLYDDDRTEIQARCVTMSMSGRPAVELDNDDDPANGCD
jgi:type IV fimbrial biogenesis protein FimT